MLNRNQNQTILYGTLQQKYMSLNLLKDLIFHIIILILHVVQSNFANWNVKNSNIPKTWTVYLVPFNIFVTLIQFKTQSHFATWDVWNFDYISFILCILVNILTCFNLFLQRGRWCLWYYAFDLAAPGLPTLWMLTKGTTYCFFGLSEWSPVQCCPWWWQVPHCFPPSILSEWNTWKCY